MPYYPDPKNQDQGIPYDTQYYWHHEIAEYLGCSVFDVLELDLVDFLAFRKEVFVSRMSETEEGRKYLRNAAMYENTDIDREGLKRFL